VSFGIVLLLMIMIAAMGIFSLSTVNEMTTKMATVDWKKSVLANDIINLGSDNARANFELFLVTRPDEISAIKTRMANNVSIIDDAIKQLDELIYAPEGKAKLALLKEKRKPYVASFKMVSELLANGDHQEAKHMMIDTTLPALNMYIASIDDLAVFQGKIMEDTGKLAQQRYEESRFMTTLLSLIAIVIGSVGAYLVTRSIIRQLGGEPNYVSEIVSLVASGDLQVKVDLRQNDTSSQQYDVWHQEYGGHII
jgi:methyl-accepting chemotaxis protein